jgi:hypothetical protein
MTEKISKQKGEIVIYRTEDGQAAINVRLQEETVWLTQAQMVKLFQRDQSVISRHIGDVFRERELDEKSNMHFLHIPHSDKPVAFFSLNVIISVGYRVKSKRGTQFRIWATNVLREHLVIGYTLNEKRLWESKLRLKELEAAVELVEKAKSAKALSASEAFWLTPPLHSVPAWPRVRLKSHNPQNWPECDDSSSRKDCSLNLAQFPSEHRHRRLLVKDLRSVEPVELG